MLGGVAEISTGTGIHCGHQHNAARIRYRPLRAGNGHTAVLDRLAEDLHGAAGKFRKFVQEQDPIVGEGELPRLWQGSASGKAVCGHRVMGRTEGPCPDEGSAGGQYPCNGMNFGGLDRFRKGHIRQDGGEPLGQHAFSGTRWADQQDIVHTGSRDLQGAFGFLLPADLGKVGQGDAGVRRMFLRDCGGKRLFPS